MLKNVFLSSCYDDYPRMQVYAKLLKEKNYAVVSRWIKGGHSINDNKFKSYKDFALEDIEDIDKCEIFIFFTDSTLNTSLGGKCVELGMAMQGNKDIKINKPYVKIYLVGQRTNVYTHLIEQQFDTFKQLLEIL